MRTSWAVMLVRGTAEPKPGSVTSAAPPTTTVVTTMTMTYVRNDALCSAGAIARLTASSPDECAVVQVLASMPRFPRPRPNGCVHHVRERDRRERERAEQQCRRDSVPHGERDVDRRAGDSGRRSRERSVEE